MHSVTPPNLPDHSILLSRERLEAIGKSGGSLGQPYITEVDIGLSPQHQGQGSGFSLLRSAIIDVGPYWLEHALYHAPVLENLTIDVHGSWDRILFAGDPFPELKQLHIYGSRLHTSSALTLLASSKHSLTDFFMKDLYLNPGSTWRQLLSVIELPNLTSFEITFPREDRSEKHFDNVAISFLGFGEDAVPKECRPGLTLIEKGPAHARRLTRLLYEGPRAGEVLNALARYATQWRG